MINQNIVGLLEWLDGERLTAKGVRAATIENHLLTVLEMQNLLAETAPESPAKEQPGEQNVAIMALKMIAEWDCLNPPRSDLLNDLPWLKRLVDRALAGHDPRVDETASQPGVHKGASEIEVEPASAAPDVAAMVRRLEQFAFHLRTIENQYAETMREKIDRDASELMDQAAALIEKLGQQPRADGKFCAMKAEECWPCETCGAVQPSQCAGATPPPPERP